MIDAAGLAPWLATLFAVVAAIAAEQAFRYGSKGAAEDRWQGTDQFYDGLGFEKESDEREARACAREIAAAYQAGATYLAAGAAVEAAAASQHDYVAIALAITGIASLVPIAIRAIHSKNEVEYIRAWYLRGKWDVARKWVRSQDFDEEDALFAKEHPVAAKAFARHKPDRTPPYET